MSLVRLFVGIFLPICFVVYKNGKRPFADVYPELFWIMHFRNFIGILGFTSLLYAAKNLPIFISQTIFNIAPFWTAIMSYFINKERLTSTTFICMIGCFIGVIILSLSKQASEGSLENTIAS